MEELLLSPTRPGVRARSSLRETARAFSHLTYELTPAMVEEVRGLADVAGGEDFELNAPAWLAAHRIELKVSLAKMQDTLNRQAIRRGQGCDDYLAGPFRRWGGELRKLSERAVSHPMFDPFIMTCIVVNCVFLAMADPTTDTVPEAEEVAGTIFLFIFTLEILLKVLTFGFAYPRDYWNWLDVVVSNLLRVPYACRRVSARALLTRASVRPPKRWWPRAGSPSAWPTVAPRWRGSRPFASCGRCGWRTDSRA